MKSYPVYVGYQIFSKLLEFTSQKGASSRFILVCDAGVMQPYGQQLQRLFKRACCALSTVMVPSGEQAKSWEQLIHLCHTLLSQNIERKTVLVVVGGGALSDLAGFAASILLRGIDWIYIPTTFLAQVDTVIGGKTAINTPHGKNLIGQFYPPKVAICDVKTFETLPDRQFKAGYVELFKHALLSGDILHPDSLYQWLCRMQKRLFFDPEVQVAAVYKSLLVKQAVIGLDWMEMEGSCTRQRLNLGHTFGHAFESLSDFQLLHGEAVALGIVAACQFSTHLGWLPHKEADRVRRHLQEMGFQVDYRALVQNNLSAFIECLMQDKKNRNETIRFILPDKRLGRVRPYICGRQDVLNFLDS